MIERRDLDGIYFRVERGGKWESICFTDLSPLEQSKVLEARTAGWLKNMILNLAAVIRRIGDDLDLVYADED